MSRDKDLRMAPGLHWNFKREEIVRVPLDTFGWLETEQHLLPSGKKSSKKVEGYGPAFFWAQCLMGDTADNIAGLPMICGDFLHEHGIGSKGQKARLVGQVLAYNLLKDCTSNKDAFELVSEAFRTSPHKFVDWRTQEPITGMQALGGDMRCLWMRRLDDNNDIAVWLSEVLE